MSPDALGFEVNAIDSTPVRGPAFAVVRIQVIATAVVAGLSFLGAGVPGVRSALFGAAVAWVTTYYASKRASVPEQTVVAALQRVMVGEFIKVVGTIALFGVATRLPHTVWPALLCGYGVALVASWLPSMTAAGLAESVGARDAVAARVTSGLGQ